VNERRTTTALRVLAVVLALLVASLVAAGTLLLLLYRDLPDLDVGTADMDAERTSVVYAADGSVLAQWHGEVDRTPVSVEDMAPTLLDAVVVAQDPRFYEHPGVDLGAVLASVWGTEGAARSGSTITQHVVEELTPEGDGGPKGRLRGALFAYELEAMEDKDRVLEAYLNLVYFGHGAYGAEAAAHHYFGKPASALTLSESALLAGVVSAPSRYSPRVDSEAARQRRDDVLDAMESASFVAPSEAEAARAAPVVVAPVEDASVVAPHFVEWVKQDLIERLGAERVFEGGLEVVTTLDPAMQREAERAAREALPYADDPEVAVVSLDPRTGEVRAMVGGRDFGASQFNLAVQSRRQPGSAFKTFVLVAALEQGIDSQARYSTAPYSVDVGDSVWNVENYRGSYPGAMLTLEDAAVHSVNAVFARLVMEIGPASVADVASRMGIASEIEPVPAIALGGLEGGVSPLEMASAYGTLATGGSRVAPSGLVRVEDADGDVVYEPDRVPESVLAEGVAAEASRVLGEAVRRGTAVEAAYGRQVAGKTGTTQSHRDAWFVGYSDELVTSVWVGFPEGQVEMSDVRGVRVTGSTFPVMVWRGFMEVAQPPGEIDEPGPVSDEPVDDSAVVTVRVCRDTFGLATDACPDVVELSLAAGQEPTQRCPEHPVAGE
jgi:membrane peptidoglycan carboxypeptidase